jgi:hypothetical protein
MQSVTSFYLASAPNGHLFYADVDARVGARLTAITPEAPFAARGLRVADTASAAARYARWPCALWRVESASKKTKLAKGVYSLTNLTVVEELDSQTALGPMGDNVAIFFAIIDNLRANNLHVTPSSADEWLSQERSSDEDNSPTWLAFKRARALAKKLEREDTAELVSDHTRGLAERAVAPLWSWDNDDGHGSERSPYATMKLNFTNACFYASAAVVLADELDPTDFALLTEDFARLTGLRPPSRAHATRA